MKIYMAAMSNNSMYTSQNLYHSRFDEHERSVLETHAPDRLESYHYIKTDRLARVVFESDIRIFLDSGAFSAHSLGANITVPQYVEYIRRNRDGIRRDEQCGCLMAAGLDAIGNAVQTWENQAEMEQALGEPPIPCYHYQEDERYCEHAVENYDYMALGGLVGVPQPKMEAWLDRIYDRYITDDQGRPRIRVHGFGITSLRIMTRYPWYSVDSSSWVQVAAFGNILIPELGVIAVSKESPKKKDEGGHYWSLTTAEQERVRQAVEGRGYEMDRVIDSTYTRRVFNIQAYREYVEQVATDTFKRERQELF